MLSIPICGVRHIPVTLSPLPFPSYASTMSVLGKATCSKSSLSTDLFPPIGRA